MLYRNLLNRLRFFREDTRGYVNLEAIIIIPALLWIFGAGWVYFDAMRQQSVNQKANYTISDMLSRETNAITGDYLVNTHRLMTKLTKSDPDDTGIRTTVVQFDGSNWSVMWSRSEGAAAPLTNTDLADYVSRLPTAAVADQLILLETWDRYVPVVNVGLGSFDIRSYSFTRARFTPQIVLAAGA